MESERGLTGLIIEEDVAGPSPVPIGSVTLVVNLSGRSGPRTTDELASELQEKPVQSVEDACQKFNVRIEGTYLDENDQTVAASIPVNDESTFTPNGLTRNDEKLFRYHVAASVCDQVAGKDATLLTEEDVAFLSETADLLERSVEAEAS